MRALAFSRSLPALLAAAALAAGCGSGQGPGPRAVLRLEGASSAGPEHNPGVEHFIERVEQLSKGNVRVVVTSPKALPDPSQTRDYPEAETTLVRHVQRGEADLGWVGTHTLGRLGISGFDALDAPMLIGSYRAEAAVLRSELPAEMLRPLMRRGLRGLAVFAGPLSRPAMPKRALVAATQYRGLKWRVLASPARDAAARAVGSRPTHDVYPWFFVPGGLLHGQIGALETDLDSLFFNLIPNMPTLYVTDNVRFWPDTTALIANPRRLARLSSQQRAWVTKAANDARDYSITHADGDAQAARDLCATGVRFAEAAPAQVAALRRSFAPAYARLERDPAASADIHRIGQLTATLPPTAPLPLPAGCTASHPAPVGSGPPVRSTIPNGVYRMRLGTRDLRRADLAGLDLKRYEGVQTLRLTNGRWTLERESPLGRSVMTGVYSGDAARTVWTETTLDGKPATQHGPVGGRFSITYSGGNLRINPVELPDDLEAVWYGSHPWKRIG